ncbi:hypothetical protein J8273_0342 [Carpediemonas membranifera]|uniref:Uncharacterized protein n=1 Tax=Carpediemonas membranifera TaxID=201153 RepID=A0A8J6E2V0_9EUKA|nr:hypothetical protein J8273_0342 [Carpediemonas membranifera]|eukprot:KAG9395123.1 hypothetical protein J8273_0342 [Carpediemonas membranifera]
MSTEEDTADVPLRAPSVKVLTSTKACKLTPKKGESEVQPGDVTHIFLSKGNYQALDNTLGAFRALIVLEVRFNQLTTISGFRAASVERLHVDHNELTSLDFLSCFPNLKALYADYNRITVGPNAFVACKHLESINLGYQETVQPVFHADSFEGLLNLDDLAIPGNRLTDLAFLAPLSSAKRLIVSDNHLESLEIFTLGSPAPKPPQLSVTELKMERTPISRSPQLPQMAVYYWDVTELNGNSLTPFQTRFLRAKQGRVLGVVQSTTAPSPEVARRKEAVARDQRLRLGGWTNSGNARPGVVRSMK